ncbi:MAG: class I SAM-dependent methyltransferase [Xenococcaceae cyanobacterium MO_207.B15]|nr:class I SAM-dependent methyltransferase [Xenococcaceae cyanobacterium MO_207.B15]
MNSNYLKISNNIKLIINFIQKNNYGINNPFKKIKIILKNGIKSSYPEQYLYRIFNNNLYCGSTSNDYHEKMFLYEEALAHVKLGKFLEIGSYLGSSAIILAEALRQKSHSIKPELYCIDTWKNHAMSEGSKDTYETFKENTKHLSEIIKCIRGKTDEIEISFDGLFDLIYIDADHSYEACLHDVKKFSPLVREGGCLILDDHISFTGVTKVVGELLASGEWYVGASYNNIIALYRDKKSINKARRHRIGNKSV